MTSGIYCYENMINGKKYIGQSYNIEKRIKTHERFLLTDKPPRAESEILWRAVKKYGRDNFSVYILEYCEANNLDEREEFYIKELKSHKTENGYNILWKGFSRLGVKHSEETKLKFSKIRKGIRHSEESKRKISESNKNKVVSEKTREKLRVANTGKIASKEAKENMSRSHIGFKHSTESKIKIRNATLGEKGYWFNKKIGVTSVFKGVILSNRDRRYWQSSIRIKGKKTHVGTYRSELEAARRYDLFVIKNKLNNTLNFPKLFYFLNFNFLFLLYTRFYYAQ